LVAVGGWIHRQQTPADTSLTRLVTSRHRLLAPPSGIDRGTSCSPRRRS